ncbi:MAG: histidinol-phosphate transaminase [Candidatus Thiodiazotropha lotti]|nr:histidinol-phosphate transaminase [Candidatus Thiodiazotropha lotti]MCW4222134.1 histidinol-phosphate transaminase [Candidatus Thiodiazotropha lotti]
MNPYWSPGIDKLSPYVPGEQPKLARLVKLNTNENPYAPSPKVIEAIREEAGENLRRYPQADSAELREVVAEYYGLQADQVFVGNGSDEVLAHTFFALFQQPKPLLFPDISYSFYPVYCGIYNIDYRTIPLREDFSIGLEDYPLENGGIIFPNPNAPTGRLLALSDIEQLLKRNRDSAVVVDEAYIDFGGESAASLIDRYPNLLVVQTLSKSRSLAGLRIGLAMGDVGLIQGLIRVKDSFNSYPMDRIGAKAAIASFKDEDYFQQIRQQIISSRDTLTEALTKLGFQVLPSAANFVFASHPRHQAETISAKLRQQGVIVRHFKQSRIKAFLRITVGTAEENQRLLEVLQQIV